MRNQRGITLIALVITIIVLLILAGVSIAMLTGQNGILTRASDATEATATSTNEEVLKLAVSDCITEHYATGTGDLNITAQALKNAITATSSDYTVLADTETPDAKGEVTVKTNSLNSNQLDVVFGDNASVTYKVNVATGAITK